MDYKWYYMIIMYPVPSENEKDTPDVGISS